MIESKYKPILVITQPDKPKGRSLQTYPTPVKEIASKYGIDCYQPDDINSEISFEYIQSVNPDLIVTVAFGSLLMRKMRKIPRFGAINLHPSVLPRHRGADPIRSTILSDDGRCGVTYFFINAKMDAGDIILQKDFNLDPELNFSALENILSNVGAGMILEVLDLVFSKPRDSFLKQDNNFATYSKKVEKDDSILDFTKSFLIFKKKLLAYNYEPGCHCEFREKRLKIFSAEIYSDGNQDTIQNQDIGRIIKFIKNKGFVVCLPDAYILITDVQYEGKKRMDAWSFHIGARLQIGEKLGL